MTFLYIPVIVCVDKCDVKIYQNISKYQQLFPYSEKPSKDHHRHFRTHRILPEGPSDSTWGEKLSMTQISHSVLCACTFRSFSNVGKITKYHLCWLWELGISWTQDARIDCRSWDSNPVRDTPKRPLPRATGSNVLSSCKLAEAAP